MCALSRTGIPASASIEQDKKERGVEGRARSAWLACRCRRALSAFEPARRPATDVHHLALLCSFFPERYS